MKRPESIPTRYDHTDEGALYRLWEKTRSFEPKGSGEPFCIATPPPNVTGDLHMGHALTFAIEDTIARNRRRRGYRVLMIPGFDHAAIAVQSLVEKKISKEENINPRSLGRDEFLKRVWQWVDYYLPRMKETIKKFGVSCDWRYSRFMMDDRYRQAVVAAFKKLFEEGLIYRDWYLVNWDTKLQTAISDEEVVHMETEGELYYIKYGKLIVATTRPETKMGDVALAVNPKDKRYNKLIGTEIEFINETGAKQKLPIIGDEAVRLDFGTGVLKVTPAHDPIDWEIGQRHKLPIKQVIDTTGRISVESSPYHNLKILEAREKIVSDLKDRGLLVKIEKTNIIQPKGDRSGSTIEPLPSKQWFVRTSALAEKAIAAAETGEISFLPKNMTKTYIHWLRNMRDWCISRQLWWGHRIPVFYKGDDIFIGDVAPDNLWQREEDVLDTWFSSALWPFATLGWPEQSDEMAIFFPTALMETGSDLMFFWVIRMVLMSQTLTGKVPFKQVLFHGMVLDEKGQKMSKSRGNVTDPIAVIERYGADALRMGLIGGTASGQTQRYREETIKKYRNFVTKVWNASRFIALLEDKSADLDKTEQDFAEKINILESKLDHYHDNYQLNLALDDIYTFFWHEFCDQLIEYEKSKADGANKSFLLKILNKLLEFLSDFAPFVTTKIKTDILTDEKIKTK